MLQQRKGQLQPLLPVLQDDQETITRTICKTTRQQRGPFRSRRLNGMVSDLSRLIRSPEQPRNCPEGGTRARRSKDGPQLEFLTKSYDVAVGDDAGGEVEEGFVNVVAAFPPDA